MFYGDCYLEYEDFSHDECYEDPLHPHRFPFMEFSMPPNYSLE